MTYKKSLKQHSPIVTWRNIHDYISLGDIVYITPPIKVTSFCFRLSEEGLSLDVSESISLNREEIEGICYDLLERGDWSSQFIGYCYLEKGKPVLYSIYDLYFHVYLDGITVQKIANEYGFKTHTILFHGSVRPNKQESISEFLMRSVLENRRVPLPKGSAKKDVVIENVSRLYEHKRIIGAWSFINPEEENEYKEGKNYTLSV